jgi:hypothetical protein
MGSEGEGEGRSSGVQEFRMGFAYNKLEGTHFSFRLLLCCAGEFVEIRAPESAARFAETQNTIIVS